MASIHGIWKATHPARVKRNALLGTGVALLLQGWFPASGYATPLSPAQVGQLAGQCAPNVAASDLVAIAKMESGFQPFTVNDNTVASSASFDTLEQAVGIASSLIEAGHSVDLGLMQINSANLGPLGLTVAQSFDPCRSLSAAGTILAGDYKGGATHEEQQTALRQAISRYNTGDPERGFRNGYVRKVEFAARATVPALDLGGGIAAPTPTATMPTAPAVPVDPNAPPSWDVWSNYDYETAHQHAPAAVTTAMGNESSERSTSTNAFASAND